MSFRIYNAIYGTCFHDMDVDIGGGEFVHLTHEEHINAGYAEPGGTAPTTPAAPGAGDTTTVGLPPGVVPPPGVFSFSVDRNGVREYYELESAGFDKQGNPIPARWILRNSPQPPNITNNIVPPLTSSGTYTEQEVRDLVTKAGGTIVDLGGPLEARFPGGRVVRYDPKPSRGGEPPRFDPTIVSAGTTTSSSIQSAAFNEIFGTSKSGSRNNFKPITGAPQAPGATNTGTTNTGALDTYPTGFGPAHLASFEEVAAAAARRKASPNAPGYFPNEPLGVVAPGLFTGLAEDLGILAPGSIPNVGGFSATLGPDDTVGPNPQLVGMIPPAEGQAENMGSNLGFGFNSEAIIRGSGLTPTGDYDTDFVLAMNLMNMRAGNTEGVTLGNLNQGQVDLPAIQAREKSGWAPRGSYKAALARVKKAAGVPLTAEDQIYLSTGGQFVVQPGGPNSGQAASVVGGDITPEYLASLGYAKGGSLDVEQPVAIVDLRTKRPIAVAGEAGPERIDITPRHEGSNTVNSTNLVGIGERPRVVSSTDIAAAEAAASKQQQMMNLPLNQLLLLLFGGIAGLGGGSLGAGMPNITDEGGDTTNRAKKTHWTPSDEPESRYEDNRGKTEKVVRPFVPPGSRNPPEHDTPRAGIAPPFIVFADGGSINVGDSSGSTKDGIEPDFPGARTGWVHNKTFDQYERVEKDDTGNWAATGKFRDHPDSPRAAKSGNKGAGNTGYLGPPEIISGAQGNPQGNRGILQGAPTIPPDIINQLSQYGVKLTGNPQQDRQQVARLAARAQDLSLSGLPQLVISEVLRNESRR